MGAGELVEATVPVAVFFSVMVATRPQLLHLCMSSLVTGTSPVCPLHLLLRSYSVPGAADSFLGSPTLTDAVFTGACWEGARRQALGGWKEVAELCVSASCLEMAAAKTQLCISV